MYRIFGIILFLVKSIGFRIVLGSVINFVRGLQGFFIIVLDKIYILRLVFLCWNERNKDIMKDRIFFLIIIGERSRGV